MYIIEQGNKKRKKQVKKATFHRALKEKLCSTHNGNIVLDGATLLACLECFGI